MNILLLVLTALDSLAQIAGNPVVGLGKDSQRVAGLIGLISMLARQGEAASAELIGLTAQIKALDTAGGPIPDSVWDAWDIRHKAAHAGLQALKDT